VLVIEANPRASRTIPYLSKAIGHPLAKYAALIAAGRTLRELGFTETPRPTLYSAKEVVLPFLKFTGVSPVLGPEMRSTGESMGISADPYRAYLKALAGANVVLPERGRVRLIGAGAAELAQRFAALGFAVVTTAPESLDDVADDALLVDLDHTPALRRALEEGVPFMSTLEAARWTVEGLERSVGRTLRVRALQDVHAVPATAQA
jgi:carbamoyl-phosphate synthase large subunit